MSNIASRRRRVDGRARRCSASRRARTSPRRHDSEAEGPRRCLALRRQRAAARAGHAVRAEADARRSRRRRSDARLLQRETIAEPVAPRRTHVRTSSPATTAARGTKADPFKGIAEADKSRQARRHLPPRPRHVYERRRPARRAASRASRSSGAARDDGEAIIDGQGGAQRSIAIGVSRRLVRKPRRSATRSTRIVTHDSERIVLRRCHIHDVDYGLAATKNDKDTVNDYFIADNVIEGRSTWPRTEGIEDRRGVQVTGAGHVVAYNRITAVRRRRSTPCLRRAARRSISTTTTSSEMTDDGIEIDYSQRNMRFFENRLTNVFQGISAQPVYGGPVYVFRNVMYNVSRRAVQDAQQPDRRALHPQHDREEQAPPHVAQTPASRSRTASTATTCSSARPAATRSRARRPPTDCDFDYDGFAGGPFGNVPQVEQRAATRPSTRSKRRRRSTGTPSTSTSSNGLFASGLKPPADEKEPRQARAAGPASRRPAQPPSTRASRCRASTTASPARRRTSARTRSGAAAPLRPAARARTPPRNEQLRQRLDRPDPPGAAAGGPGRRRRDHPQLLRPRPDQLQHRLGRHDADVGPDDVGEARRARRARLRPGVVRRARPARPEAERRGVLQDLHRPPQSASSAAGTCRSRCTAACSR